MYEDYADGVWWFNHLASLELSIDFIDYLCAKNFAQVVEDWLNSLEEAKNRKVVLYLYKRIGPINTIFSNLSTLSIAVFIAAYAWLASGRIGSPGQIAYLVAFALVLWTVSTVAYARIGRGFAAVLSRSLIPSTILLTAGDLRAFKRHQDRAQQVLPKAAGHAVGAFVAILLNVLASYLYAWLSN